MQRVYTVTNMRGCDQTAVKGDDEAVCCIKTIWPEMAHAHSWIGTRMRNVKSGCLDQGRSVFIRDPQRLSLDAVLIGIT